SAATPALTFTAPVDVDGTNLIQGISCPTPSFCAAVDEVGDVLTSANPAGGAAAWTSAKVDSQTPIGISCASPTLCVIADIGGRVVTSTNPSGGASAWTVTTLLSGAFLFVPSCPSVSFCALPAEDVGATGFGVYTSTNPAGGAAAWALTPLNTEVNDAACPSASLCVLKGRNADVLTSTNPTGGTATWVTADIDGTIALTSISCASASLCAAVDNAGQVLTATNPRGGSANFWSAADIDGSTILNRVSCPSTSPAFCAAVDTSGNVVSSTMPPAGASAWSVQTVDGSPLTALACATNALCVAGDNRGQVVVGTGTAGGPAVTGIAPAQGPTAGGTSVAITGTGFSTAAGATTVAFGATAATGVTCSSATSCTAVAPAAGPGVVNVTATVAGASSPAGPLNNFTYQAPGPPPTVTALAPAQGPAGGGTVVTISGTGFSTAPGATSVGFSGQPATNVSCSSTTTCVATSPPGLGPQIVIVTVAGQTSSGSSATTFVDRPPLVAGVAPGNGSTAGGTAVTLTGANFDTVPGTTQVTFGSTPAAAVTCASSTTCVATSPPGSGAVFIRVTEGPFTTPATSAVSFTYASPPVAAISCGATVTQSITLTTDLGPCPGNGLVVVGSALTVNLAGHRLYGSADRSDNRVGIELAGVTNVTVTGSTSSATQSGDVDGFASGVSIDGGSHNTITQLDIHDNAGPPTFSSNRGDGIVIGSVTASSHNVVSNSVVAHNGVFDGVGVFSAGSKGN
ncbi:MAG TPA: IPT/TIG domain-containing protein, partial [Candidatus Dormibacteraeota bacterium]|nr:IPT/TIG domain-containing protein [Candidatus Dormibacteraeota bacterium]